MTAKQRLMIAAAAVAVVGAGALLCCVNGDKGAEDVASDGGGGVSSHIVSAAPKVQDPKVAAIPAASTVPLAHASVADRFSGFEVIASESAPTADPQSHRRTRLVRGNTKYPFVRIEESLSVDAATGVETLLGQLAMVGDHVIVRLKAGRTRDDLANASARHGFTVRDAIGRSGCFLVSMVPATLDSVVTLSLSLGKAACVDLVEPDYLVELAETTPDDSEYALLWGMNKIQMPKVWDMTTGVGEGVVAVFDTGTDVDHPDLLGNIWSNTLEIAGNGLDDDENGYIDDLHGWDFYSNDNDPTDGHSHGTHVAGTIGAVGNNSYGVSGVAWKSRIMTIRIFGSNGEFGTVSDVIAGVYYVITHRINDVPVRVTNHSWGGDGRNQLLRDALEIAGGLGVLHIAAAGNSGNLNNDIKPHYPSSFTLSNLVSVANTTESDGLHYVSHYGASSVDLGAPGSSILSTYLGGSYANKTGTSMSCPHVAGVAALMLDYMPHLTWQQVRQALLDGVDPVSSLAGKCVTEGRLNAFGTFEALAPHIAHTPLDNTTDVSSGHVVEAEIRPGTPFLDTNRVVVLWNTTGSTNGFSTNLMQHVSNDVFRATIPPHSEGRTIHYMIRAESRTGLFAASPAAAPAALHSFDVTYPVPLWVFGYPAEHGRVDPGYGEQTAPWGSTVEATASLYSPESGGSRQHCTGWIGDGSVPTMGVSNSISFVIRGWSGIQWMWQEQFSLTQESVPSEALSTVSWWDAGTQGSTVVAPPRVDIAGTPHAFVNWIVDGVRHPDEGATAENPAVGLTMTAARQSSAVYIPEAQDDDADGLPDWWELFNFAHLGSASTNDPDGDGHSNADELADNADPRDAASVPAPPVIEHVPLDNPMGSISPWTVAARVTDNSAVSSVSLAFKVNGGSWNPVVIQNTESNVYEGVISGPHAPGDTYLYAIEAVDEAGNQALGPTHAFDVAYPLASVLPDRLDVTLMSRSSTDSTITVVNDGNADLTWRLLTNRIDAIDANDSTWSHAGANDQWHTSTQEVRSAGYAWHCGDAASGLYGNLVDASLVVPAVLLGAQPTFSFWHWAKIEYDGSPGFETHYWDGGVVDISTDGGISFERITPVGGYPHKITPNPASPFPDNTPCFGSTEGWESVTFDLAAYAGETVQIRFRFGSDEFVVDQGWFIDDVEFRWGATWLDVPTESGLVAPASREAVTVRLNATHLDPGEYRGAIILACNDPTHPTLEVPVDLHVLPPTEVSTIALAEDTPNAFVITWHASTGSFYSLMLSTGLNGNAAWDGVPGYTNLPGIAGTMSYTGTIDHIASKFYRIDETQP
jgi:subtilisin family serine protease